MLVDILSRYQEEIGNTDSQTLEQLEALRSGKACVVTGQQVGFMGGPLYTIAKALSCVHLAREKGLVPIFWAATEDHDVEEVAWTYLLSEGGDLRRYGVALPQGKFVEDIPFTPEHLAEIERFGEAVGIDFRPVVEGSTRYAEAMIRVLVDLFRGTGLLFVEPRLLRPLATEFFARELSDAVRFRAILQGSEGPLVFREGETNLFYKNGKGDRIRVMEGESGFDVLSTGVAARPVLQCSVIPTAIYVAGPNELAYWKQLPAYFAAHGVPYPEVVQRASLTLIPDEMHDWLARGNLTPKQQHILNNLLHPRNRPQERVLNFFYFRMPINEIVTFWDSPQL